MSCWWFGPDTHICKSRLNVKHSTPAWSWLIYLSPKPGLSVESVVVLPPVGLQCFVELLEARDWNVAFNKSLQCWLSCDDNAPFIWKSKCWRVLFSPAIHRYPKSPSMQKSRLVSGRFRTNLIFEKGISGRIGYKSKICYLGNSTKQNFDYRFLIWRYISDDAL